MSFPAELYADGPSRVVPLDLSAALRTPYPATSPALVASFVRINEGEQITLRPNATSQLLCCIRGRGHTLVDGRVVRWEEGDFLTLPAAVVATHVAGGDTAFYHVVDTPLLDSPGTWHSQHNGSGRDAGLQTYLRTLDIRFSDKA